MKKKLKDINVIGVSIVIVTYNGSDKLEPTLLHIAKQEYIDFKCELLVIDNNSNDGTAEIVTKIWELQKKPFDLRIIKEPKSGTMYARERGLKEAKYRYILFCDDDNWLNSKYVRTAFNIITTNYEIAAVGGLGIMKYEKGFTPPKWMKEQYERSFGTGSQGNKDGDITNAKGCLYTAGAIMDRVWLDKLYSLGFVWSLKGRNGKSLVGGEDTELTLALKLIGGKLFYNSAMKFMHYMTKERINWKYLKKLWKGFGFSNFLTLPYKQINTNLKEINYLKYFVTTLKQFLSLYFYIRNKKLMEGDVEILQLEILKGTLLAMVFKHNRYKKSESMSKKILEMNKMKEEK